MPTPALSQWPGPLLPACLPLRRALCGAQARSPSLIPTPGTGDLVPHPITSTLLGQGAPGAPRDRWGVPALDRCSRSRCSCPKVYVGREQGQSRLFTALPVAAPVRGQSPCLCQVQMAGQQPPLRPPALMGRWAQGALSGSQRPSVCWATHALQPVGPWVLLDQSRTGEEQPDFSSPGAGPPAGRRWSQFAVQETGHRGGVGAARKGGPQGPPVPPSGPSAGPGPTPRCLSACACGPPVPPFTISLALCSLLCLLQLFFSQPSGPQLCFSGPLRSLLVRYRTAHWPTAPAESACSQGGVGGGPGQGGGPQRAGRGLGAQSGSSLPLPLDTHILMATPQLVSHWPSLLSERFASGSSIQPGGHPEGGGGSSSGGPCWQP